MKKILFYCSWGGFGHIARAYAVSKFLNTDAKIIVCSPQDWIFPKLPNVKFVKIHEPKSRFRFEQEKIIRQDYGKEADEAGYRKHIFQYYDLLKKFDPDLVVVDNPAEVAISTKMLGYKTMVVYETLKTDDLRWRLAWGNVDKVLVPYTDDFTNDLAYKYSDNSFFSGGYSRFEKEALLDREKARNLIRATEDKKVVMLTVGKGRLGELFEQIVSQLMKHENLEIYFPYYKKDEWSVALNRRFERLKIVYAQTDLRKYFCAADLIITGAGYNSMMEAFEFNIPTILIPLERIYGEQINKAKTAERLGAAMVLDVEKENWPDQLSKNIENSDVLHEKMIEAQKEILSGSGAEKTAKFIIKFLDKETDGKA